MGHSRCACVQCPTDAERSRSRPLVTPSAVLLSGGLDSAVLLALEMRDGGRPQPIHVRAGLAWEPAEARAIARLLAAPPFHGRLPPLATLSVDMHDVYPPTHWAITGHPPA